MRDVDCTGTPFGTLKQYWHQERSFVAAVIMPKHTTEDNESSDFWKRMRYGAAAAVTLGSGIYAAASVLKKRGLVTSIVDDVKVAMHTAPQLLQSAQVPNMPMNSTDHEETRAVLNMQLQFAMQRQNMQHDQQQQDNRKRDHMQREKAV